MARRRKPINFDLINSGNKDELKRVLEDLAKKRPCGPEQRLHAEDYEECWDDSAQLPGDRPHSGGYSDIQCYNIAKLIGVTGAHVDEWDVRQGLRELYGWGHFGKSALTRRSRRLRKRLGHGYRVAVSEGMIGDSIWHVSMRNTDAGADFEIAVVASSQDTAKQISESLFGFALGEVRYTEFQKQGDASGCQAKNTRARERAERMIADYKSRIAMLQKKVEVYEAATEAIDMYSITAFA